MKATDFGKDFLWGFATSAAQIEGAWDQDGRQPSIWDTFARKKKLNGKHRDHPSIACDHVNRYQDDVRIMHDLGVNSYRYSISWSRVLEYDSRGFSFKINQSGMDFYRKLSDELQKKGIRPFVTLYHWDLPQILQERGGWTNRDIIPLFREYVSAVTDHLSPTVKDWMVLNEPIMFTLLGYGIGMHAPGKKGVKNLLKSMHHANLAQAMAAADIKKKSPQSRIGTSNAIIDIQPFREDHKGDILSADRYRALFSRAFVEPYLGMGYPTEKFPMLQKIEKYFREGDDWNIQFHFDFWGVNHYSRNRIKTNRWFPYVKGRILTPPSGTETTQMGWEVYPEGLYNILKWMSSYRGVKNIMITENGAAMEDVPEEGRVHDPRRIEYYKAYLSSALKAKKEGVPLTGYFSWSFLDNFEWAEGYRPRFGMVHVDYPSGERIPKDSALWYRDFIAGK